MRVRSQTRAGICCECTNARARMRAHARARTHGTKVIDMSRTTAKERNRMLRMNNNELAILVQVTCGLYRLQPPLANSTAGLKLELHPLP